VKGPEKPSTVFGYGWVWIKLLYAAMRLTRRDLVVTMTDPPLQVMIGRAYAKVKGCHHIHWCQDLYPDLFSAIGANIPGPLMHFLKKMSRKSMKKCDRVVVIGRCMARQLTHTGVETSRVIIIPNWSDSEIVPANAPTHFSQHNNVPGNLIRDDTPKFRVLYAGSIGRAHPMKTVLDAAGILAPYPEIEFVFVGDSPGHERLARERDRRGLTNVRFLPYQPDSMIRALMESGDVHLVSMRPEAAGMMVPCKFYSALAAGRPCVYVGPKDTEIARVISDYRAGDIVTPGEAAQLADAILRYRMDGQAWFDAQQGALLAGKTFYAAPSVDIWMKRALDAVHGRI
jgi:colanic acid biosynthesis glycosyl transferase WcaI